MTLYDLYIKIAKHEHVRRIITHRHFVTYEKYVSLILWLTAIYYLSSKSLNVFAAVDIWGVIIRKMAHMFEYAVLTALLFRILHQTEKRHAYWNLSWSFVFAVFYAVSDEYHQTLISGRHGVYTDVLIDAAGSLVAVWLLALSWKHKKSQKKNSN